MATSAPLQARHSDDYDSDEDPDDSNDAQLYRQLMGPSSRGARCMFVDPATNVPCNYAARSHSVKRHIEARHLGIKSVVPSTQVHQTDSLYRRHQCPHCSQLFSQKASLERHINTQSVLSRTWLMPVLTAYSALAQTHMGATLAARHLTTAPGFIATKST
jgi:hypothetical protein